jgi:hypothetical protein
MYISWIPRKSLHKLRVLLGVHIKVNNDLIQYSVDLIPLNQVTSAFLPYSLTAACGCGSFIRVYTGISLK